MFLKKYKYVLSEQNVSTFIEYMKKNNISDLVEKEYELIKIMDNYGWLDEIKRYYFNKFKGKYLKTNLPIKNDFDMNIEFILEILKEMQNKI